jgi:GDP-D-mannose dehydratase
MKKVLVTGTLGQDGANMCEFLLENTDHEVYGMIRRLRLLILKIVKNSLITKDLN